MENTTQADCWIAPSDITNRPVAVLGAGVLGRRIASCWAAAGFTVHLYDPVEQQRAEALAYIYKNKSAFQKYAKTTCAGKFLLFSDLESAVACAWHVVECVPESLPLKQATFTELQILTASDCILATNSSSFRSSVVSERLGPVVRQRVLNTHYFMLPHIRAVELMTNGSTAPEVLTFLADRMKALAGLNPYVAKKESTGFIQNRVWAAIKREMLQVVSEGVTDPKTADDIFYETVVLPGARPFYSMDLVGLDTVALIEQNYAQERSLDTTHTVDFLQSNYLSKGKLGNKSSQGGFFPPPDKSTAKGPRLFVLDNGLSGQVDTLETGQVLEYSSTGQYVRTLFENQYLPDGIVVLKEKNLLYWTCMGYPGEDDGMLYCSNIDGTNAKPLLRLGVVNTPKQITIDHSNEKLYFADREGLCIWRCNFDGSDLEQVVRTGNKKDAKDQTDATKWCVGVTVSHLGKIFWTQKGPPKGWQGRIFSANIEIPPNETAATRSDIICLASGLAEPVDLAFHVESNSLYWTDRGEMPFGNTLNRLCLGANGKPLQHAAHTPLLKHQIVARKFHEAIGLTIDAPNGHVYVTDMGGSVSRCNLDGSDKTRLVFEEERSWTGIALG